MQATPAPEANGSVRPVTEADLPAIEELSARIYKTSQRNEVAGRYSVWVLIPAEGAPGPHHWL
jgi:hypothetical protein